MVKCSQKAVIMDTQKQETSGRNKKLNLKVTLHEYEIIKEKAISRGLSIAAYIRSKAIDKK